MIGSVVPHQILAYPGSHISIYCGSHHSPVWTKNGSLAQNAFIFNNMLFLKGVSESNNGIYWCRGTKEYGMHFMKSSSVNVGG